MHSQIDRILIDRDDIADRVDQLAEAIMADLAAHADKGELVIEDFDLAADQFAELCRADLVPRVLFNIDPDVSDEDRKRVIDGAVETFLARYAAPPD